MAELERMLEEAVEAGQSGDLQRARKLLLTLLRKDNSKPLYWLLMSTCVDSKEEREYCLHNVLKLDPQNSAAIHDLKLIGSALPEESEELEGAELGDDWQTKEIAAPRIVKKKKVARAEPWPLSNIVAAVAAGLLLILIGFRGINEGWINLDGDEEATPNSVPGVLISPSTSTSVSSGVTEVAQATATLEAVATEVVIVEARDPSDLIAVPFTPTPLVVVTAHPDSPTFSEALAAFQFGDFGQAIALFGLHLASEPNSADAEYYIGHSFLGLGDYENAWQSFSRSIALSQQFAPAYVGRAQASQALERPASDIITDLNSAILLDNQLMEGHLERGRFYLLQNDAERSLSDLEAAELLAPESVEVQALKAEALLALKDFDAARIAGERTLDADPTRLSNYLVLSEIYFELGEFNAVLGLMQSYLSFEPESAQGWELLGAAYFELGENGLAVDALDKALSFDARLGQASYYRALVYLNDGQSSAAIPWLGVAIDSEASWFEPRIALARAQLLAGDPGAAFFEANVSAALVENDAQQAAFHFWRASALEALGQADTALGDWISLLALPADSVSAEWIQIARERTIGP
jgi:tetratricopeptide (TPR) repeat protein